MSFDTIGQSGTSQIADGAITNAKLASDAVTNIKVAAAAAITYAKLNLALGIVDADVSATAAIAASKLGAFSISQVPHRIIILGTDYSSIGAGTWSVNGSATQILYMAWTNQTTAADADNITYTVLVPAGTYALDVVTSKDAANGILKVDIDGAAQGTLDCYSATAVSNTILAITGQVLTAGSHTIRLRVQSKNAGSSGYRAYFSYMALRRTA